MTNRKENSKKPVIANAVKQSHNANDNNKQIASSFLRSSQQALAMTHARVPKLRFKEFDGEWEEKKLGEVSSKVSYGMNSAAIAFDGKHKYLRITDIDEETREFIPSPLTSPDGFIEDKFKMKLNDIVFARTGASTGKSYLYNQKDGDLYYAGFLIKFNISKANPYFVYSQTFRENYREWVQVYSMRSGQPGLNAEEYKCLKINLPNLQEQQKIANVLTAIDTKINQLNTKKETLQQYKKGVMQQLFSQALRFKDEDGNAFADWKEKKLGEVCEMTSSKRVYLDDYVSEGIPFYRGKEISELRLNKKPSDILFITNERYEEFKSKYGVPSKNDILITAVGTLGNVLRIRNDDAFYFKDGNLIWLRKITENPEFLEILLEWETRELIKTSIGSTQKALTMVELRKLKFKFPNVKEQQKIANYLSAIDSKIETVNTQLTKTQQFKKGLLQQMFV